MSENGEVDESGISEGNTAKTSKFSDKIKSFVEGLVYQFNLQRPMPPERINFSEEFGYSENSGYGILIRRLKESDDALFRELTVNELEKLYPDLRASAKVSSMINYTDSKQREELIRNLDSGDPFVIACLAAIVSQEKLGKRPLNTIKMEDMKDPIVAKGALAG